MTLKNALNKFIENQPRVSLLHKDYSVFTPIAEAILNGYFEVREGNAPIKFVRPTKVEFYYHEEFVHPEDILKENISQELNQLYSDEPTMDKNLLIKDFIVYHRNRPKNLPIEHRPHKTSWEQEVPIALFHTPGILNNHQSGIDITFEHKITVNEKKVNVRASALIRGYYIYVNENDCIERRLLLNSGNKIQYADDRSSYLYDHLYGSSCLFEGISVQWKDGEQSALKTMNVAARTNVFQYEENEKWKQDNASKDDDYVVKKPLPQSQQTGTAIKYEPDIRELQFFNTEFYPSKTSNQ